MTKQVKTYTDRDDEFRVEFLKDGSPVEDGVITKAELEFPYRAFVGGVPEVIDTDTPMVELVDNSTAILVNLNDSNLREGTHICRLTVWDVSTTNGIPWGEFEVKAEVWSLQN